MVSACAALVTVATLDDARGLSAVQSAAIIGVLGVGVAARILANQIRSTQAHADARRALGDKERALAEADLALERVREANETLRQSEEHLRLVFEAAVDGIVELDHRDVILRANDAFCGMVRIDRASIEGLPWTALAASVTGADASFVSLPATGQGTIQRSEGQPLYLESRISEVPMTPPRRLLLVRDVTAGKIADQTIRSLFKFLQDRDEDRTRLLRRSNSAIEAERNRIARDLHDGPVQGVSAASLSLEAALLMIKAGDTDRGTEILTKIRKELAEEADGLRELDVGAPAAAAGRARADPGDPRDARPLRDRARDPHGVLGNGRRRDPRRPGDARLSRGAGGALERREALAGRARRRRGRARSGAAPRGDHRRRRRVRQRSRDGSSCRWAGWGWRRCANAWSSRAGRSWCDRRPVAGRRSSRRSRSTITPAGRQLNVTDAT